MPKWHHSRTERQIMKNTVVKHTVLDIKSEPKFRICIMGVFLCVPGFHNGTSMLNYISNNTTNTPHRRMNVRNVCSPWLYVSPHGAVRNFIDVHPWQLAMDHIFIFVWLREDWRNMANQWELMRLVIRGFTMAHLHQCQITFQITQPIHSIGVWMSELHGVRGRMWLRTATVVVQRRSSRAPQRNRLLHNCTDSCDAVVDWSFRARHMHSPASSSMWGVFYISCWQHCRWAAGMPRFAGANESHWCCFSFAPAP